MDIAQRIAQFEAMVRPEADPNNDMAWFSLGQAYSSSARHADAAAAFLRCVELNPAMSKAWQLAGQSLVSAGETARAGEVLTKGVLSAAERGDRLPQKAMSDLLTKLGMPVPEMKSAATSSAAAIGTFMCTRTGRPGMQLARAPMRGPIGAWIQANISKETWDSWIAQGTKVINELRLDLSKDQDAETYDRYMREFLGIDDALLAELTGSAPRSA
jgi:Fe-S cluster biosynthesis and repair protein YggX